jgi:glutaredoxin 3
MEVKVYSKTVCPFCTQAKAFLKRNDIGFTEINLDDDEERVKFYETVGNGIRSVPQIYVDGERIGGYQELVKSDIVARKNAGNFNEDF